MISKNNDFTLKEFGMKTDLERLSDYQVRIQNDQKMEE